MQEPLAQLQTAQAELEPQFKALRAVMAALNTAVPLAAATTPDALPMQKALSKLELAAAEVESETLSTAVTAFAAATQTALDNLAFEFAKDLRDEFEKRGETVHGRPPTLVVGLLTLHIDIAARKGQWLYGKEPLTSLIPLSLSALLKAYDQQFKRIANRQLDPNLLPDLYKAWDDGLKKRDRKPTGGRINIVETYAQLIMNRQNTRFWNAPSRSTFKDYERDLFIRDLVLLREQNATSLTVDGENRQLKLGVATKSQAEQTSRAIWLPENDLDGQYYSDIAFD